MHPETMKHKASLWFGEFGTSVHITDVYWEGDISQQELMAVADQISPDWQTIDLELDPHHPRHGQTYRLTKPGPSRADEEDALRALEMEDALEGKYVWVHCCQVVMDPEGDLVDVAGRHYRQDFSTVMFCTEFTSFEDVALQCDENFGKGEWDEYELYLDDELPLPVASFG
jgi:hypothetical protein